MELAASLSHGADRQGLSEQGTTLSIQGRASVIFCEIHEANDERIAK